MKLCAKKEITIIIIRIIEAIMHCLSVFTITTQLKRLPTFLAHFTVLALFSLFRTFLRQLRELKNDSLTRKGSLSIGKKVQKMHSNNGYFSLIFTQDNISCFCQLFVYITQILGYFTILTKNQLAFFQNSV